MEAIVTPTFVDVLIALFVHEFRGEYKKDLTGDACAIGQSRSVFEHVQGQTALLTFSLYNELSSTFHRTQSLPTSSRMKLPQTPASSPSRHAAT